MKYIKACVKRFIGQNSEQFFTQPSKYFPAGEAEHVSTKTRRYYLSLNVHFQDCLLQGDQTRLSNRQR